MIFLNIEKVLTHAGIVRFLSNFFLHVSPAIFDS